jgi:transposase
MGRSRGGLTTKIHVLVDADGLPVDIVLSKGQAHDGPIARQFLHHLGEGGIFMGDKAYDADGLRAEIAERGAWANIPSKSNRRDPPPFSAFLYRFRNLAERFFNKLKHFRAVATRYEKRADNYLALIKLAAVRIWLRANESTT